MCLGIPGRIVAIEGMTALVDFWGVRKRVALDLVDEPVQAGDYILNHVGYAIRRIPEDDIEGTLALYRELIGETGSGDLMSADVAGELESLGDVERVGQAEIPTSPKGPSQ